MMMLWYVMIITISPFGDVLSSELIKPPYQEERECVEAAYEMGSDIVEATPPGVFVVATCVDLPPFATS